MKKFRPMPLDSNFSEFQHSARYIERREMQLELLDELSHEERALVWEYGFDRAAIALRRFYGRPQTARAFLEAERKALQVARWENKTGNGA